MLKYVPLSIMQKKKLNIINRLQLSAPLDVIVNIFNTSNIYFVDVKNMDAYKFVIRWFFIYKLVQLITWGAAPTLKERLLLLQSMHQENISALDAIFKTHNILYVLIYSIAHFTMCFWWLMSEAIRENEPRVSIKRQREKASVHMHLAKYAPVCVSRIDFPAAKITKILYTLVNQSVGTKTRVSARCSSSKS